MSRREPRWEIVRASAGWHARFRSSNGNVIVSSEVYARKSNALRAIELVTGFDIYESPHSASGYEAMRGGRGLLEIRFLDERPENDPIPDVHDADALGAWAYRQPAVKREVDADKKIHAIKELRALADCGLREAKEAIETLPGMEWRWER